MATEEEKLREEIKKLKEENLELRRETSNKIIRRQFVLDIKSDRTPYFISIRAIGFMDRGTLQRVAQEQYLMLKSKGIIPNRPINFQAYEEVEITRFELNKLKGKGLTENNILIEFIVAERGEIKKDYYIVK